MSNKNDRTWLSGYPKGVDFGAGPTVKQLEAKVCSNGEPIRTIYLHKVGG